MKTWVKSAKELVALFTRVEAEDNTLTTVGKTNLFGGGSAVALKLPHARADRNAGRLDELRPSAIDALSSKARNFSHSTEGETERLFSGRASKWQRGFADELGMTVLLADR